ASAFSTPRRAIVQKSAELLVTKASLIVFGFPTPVSWAGRQPALRAPHATNAARRRTMRSFMTALNITIGGMRKHANFAISLDDPRAWAVTRRLNKQLTKRLRSSTLVHRVSGRRANAIPPLRQHRRHVIGGAVIACEEFVAAQLFGQMPGDTLEIRRVEIGKV